MTVKEYYVEYKFNICAVPHKDSFNVDMGVLHFFWKLKLLLKLIFWPKNFIKDNLGFLFILFFQELEYLSFICWNLDPSGIQFTQ